MMTSSITTPDGITHVAKIRTRPFPYAVVVERDETSSGEPGWHVNFASTEEKANREARIQSKFRGYHVQVRQTTVTEL